MNKERHPGFKAALIGASMLLSGSGRTAAQSAPIQDRQADSTMAWIHLKGVISYLESLSAPIAPADLADALKVNRSVFLGSAREDPISTQKHDAVKSEDLKVVNYGNFPDEQNLLTYGVTIADEDELDDSVHMVHVQRITMAIHKMDKTLCIPENNIIREIPPLGWRTPDEGHNKYSGGGAISLFHEISIRKNGVLTSISINQVTSCFDSALLITKLAKQLEK